MLFTHVVPPAVRIRFRYPRSIRAATAAADLHAPHDPVHEDGGCTSVAYLGRPASAGVEGWSTQTCLVCLVCLDTRHPHLFKARLAVEDLLSWSSSVRASGVVTTELLKPIAHDASATLLVDQRVKHAPIEFLSLIARNPSTTLARARVAHEA